MFQKPAFGTNTTGFGMQSTFGSPAATTSPFGGFKPAATATSAFGAPSAFGASAAAQPAAGGGLFGATNTSGGLFGGAAPAAAPAFGAPTPAFGAPTTGFGFGATTSTGGGLFNNSTTGGGLFQPQQNNTAFGAKPAGFGFGASAAQPATGALFGATQQAGTTLFPQQNTMQGGLFNNTSGGFGAQATGTAHVKYSPLVGTDVVVKSGASQNVNIKHHCITCMKEYENKSLEELRLEDYMAGRKVATAGVFGFTQPEAKPLFGATSTFGAPATTSAPSVFGAPTLGAAPFGQTNTFSFGGGAPTNTSTTGLFGAQKPAFGATSTAGTSLFGAPASTQASTFGTNTSSFGFGSNLQNQNTGGLFGAKPASTGFGAAPATSGFGGFGAGGGLFGAKPAQSAATTFGAQPAVGSMAGGFGTATSSAGLFGGGAFGKPAVQTAAPAFGLGAAQNTLGLNTGLGSSTFGQNKLGGGGFGLGGGLGQQNNTTFRTGLDGGLGGGLFNNSLGTSLGLGAPGGLASNNLCGSSAAGNVHEQILALAARPYGDSPLFKNLPDSGAAATDALRPTNPSAQASVMSRAETAYRVTSPTGTRLTLRPKANVHDKKSLFDGLEESDASLEGKLSLKPSRKRLVLRPNQRDPHTDSVDGLVGPSPSFRQEELPEGPGLPAGDKENEARDNGTRRTPDLTNDHYGERSGSWLESTRLKERAIDGQTTPRLYPNLDNDLQTEVTERRASWLTTKLLRKPQAGAAADVADNSVRELAVREPSREPLKEKEPVDSLSVSEDESAVPAESPARPPHPAGVKCTRPGYYTIPSLDEITSHLRPDGTCKLPHLTIGRTNYGNVFYDAEIDVKGLDIDSLVFFLNKEVIVYPEDADKPPVGEGLNRRAVVTLDRVWPRDKTDKRPIQDPDRLLKMDYEGKLRRVCDKHDTKFMEYRPETGSWVFRVEHFSKYGLTDSDEEDAPDVLKRQLVSQTPLKNAAPPAPVAPLAPLAPPARDAVVCGPPLLAARAGLGGLGLSGGGLIPPEDSIFAMHQSSINLLGATKAFEMDTTEDNNTEPHSLYQEHRGFGVKSPTGELARLEHRHSAHVQLMKASLYADTEMEDDVSVSTGDQLVPLAAPSATLDPPVSRLVEQQHATDDAPPTEVHQESAMRPLLVEPHTIVLRYHRKVPPFKLTIAGRLGASHMSDLSVSRARHCRAGWGRGDELVYVATHAGLDRLPKHAELCDLSPYVSGRSDEDWSESAVVRLALLQPDTHYNVQEALSRHLESLFEYSTFTQPDRADACPRLRLCDSPRERYAALQQLIRNAEMTHTDTPRFGVDGAYCLEVFKLCEALWGADLENGGVPGTDVSSIVSRHRSLLSWLSAGVADITDRLLSQPTLAEKEDESDGHSGRVWTLLLGGRMLEACRVARENGDLNMAALIAQAAGDPSFRSLVSRQLALWRECGADSLVSSHKLAVLQLISGSPPADKLAEADWRQAFYATARYLSPQVPSLEQVVRRYEALFSGAEGQEVEGEEGGAVDLASLPHDEMGMRLPLPPYSEDYSYTIEEDGKRRSVLDLRYEVIRARAFNTRPRLRPAQYSPDTMDYSLCFVLGVWFGDPSPESVVGVAELLEGGGAWHRAVHALCYLPDEAQRSHLIRGVVSRNAPAQATTPDLRSRLDLMKALRIPHKWILLAQAHRAKYQHLPGLEAEHLVGAEQWNAAHRVLLDELLPEAVLADDLQRVAPLLEKLNEAAGRHEVSGWESGGRALYQYMHVCDEIRNLVSCSEREGAGREGVSRRVEALRPAVGVACRALSQLTHKSGRHAAARAEMGARLVQLSLAAGDSPHHVATLLNALRLPPDCTQSAHHKVTSELAEQAAELCIESATDGSPASHRRAARALHI